MKFFSCLFFLLFFSSCSDKSTLSKYNSVVDSSDKIIYYTKIKTNFIVSREVINLEDLINSKNILKRNIKVEEVRNLNPTNKIELYKKDKIIGTFLISDYVTFASPCLNFGFPLTYGIGMSL